MMTILMSKHLSSTLTNLTLLTNAQIITLMFHYPPWIFPISDTTILPRITQWPQTLEVKPRHISRSSGICLVLGLLLGSSLVLKLQTLCPLPQILCLQIALQSHQCADDPCSGA